MVNLVIYHIMEKSDWNLERFTNPEFVHKLNYIPVHSENVSEEVVNKIQSGDYELFDYYARLMAQKGYTGRFQIRINKGGVSWMDKGKSFAGTKGFVVIGDFVV